MNTLVIYESTYGNTKQLVLKMVEVFREHGYVQPIPVSEIDRLDHPEWDLIIIAGPTQRHKISPALNTLVRTLPRRALRGRCAAAFDTRYNGARWLTGTAAGQLADRLRRAGATLLLPPESFFVTAREGPLAEGEIERAAQWARTLIENFQRQEQLKQQKTARSALV